MFSGIVAAVGRITHLSAARGDEKNTVRLSIEAGALGLDDVALGDSIACNGVCLTVVELEGQQLPRRCLAGDLPAPSGWTRPVRSTSKGTARLRPARRPHRLRPRRWRRRGAALRCRRRQPAAADPRTEGIGQVHRPQGSITVERHQPDDQRRRGTDFTINLIPHTLQNTTLHLLAPGAKVNLEVDLIARYCERPAQPGTPESWHLPWPTSPHRGHPRRHPGGQMVILVDEEDRENEGDLVMAAEHVTPEAINFMAKWGRGLICLTLPRPLPPAQPAADGARQQDAARHRLHRLDRGRRGRHHRHLGRRPRPHRAGRRGEEPRRSTTSSSPATSSR